MFTVSTEKGAAPLPFHANSILRSAQEITAGIKAGRVSAEQVVRASFLHIEETEPRLKAWEYVDFSGALAVARSEEHTSELQSRGHLVCRHLLEKQNNNIHV